MDNENVQDIFGIAIQFILIGLFLTFCIFAFHIRSSFAVTRNEQIDSTRKIREARQFSKFKQNECTGHLCDGHVYGDDIIELLREHAAGDLEIYINKVSETGISLRLNSETSVREANLFTTSSLNTLLNTQSEFHPYLIYDGGDVTNSIYYNKNSTGQVTGVAFVWISDNK
ncbi:hypothetical protein acsn021_06590 [Anaerocolumna cellulosilytica]|uniref:Uncharacterized protein n=1 Tax=Anaerocolumna cellulosilytica TaxID=433286 RepID=A0A6S6R1B0_9FIRM|nr:hypothetical protein [Anaerocolumna cellulosilytica]MBB5197686.1 hypothetical protein [Anaerocolumna cellulosilytica]BCJ93090.1 hypothetical protein acsn021_06590 [Anaerocolumna cellulosilytica]